MQAVKATAAVAEYERDEGYQAGGENVLGRRDFSRLSHLPEPCDREWNTDNHAARSSTEHCMSDVKTPPPVPPPPHPAKRREPLPSQHPKSVEEDPEAHRDGYRPFWKAQVIGRPMKMSRFPGR